MLHGQKQVEETAGREMVGHVMRRGNGENGGAEEIAATGTTCGAFRRKVEQALCEIRDGRCPQDGDLLRLLQPGPPASRSKGGGMSAEARLKLRGGEGLTAANVVGIPPPPTAAGGREYPGEEASKGWADLMLRELHPLPQDGLLQVGVRAHAAEDDEEGEVVMAEPVDPSMQQSAERVYVVDPGAVVKTTIRNLGEQALTLTPVLYARKSQCSAGGQGLEEDRQDRVTLKQGEESEMPFVVSVDVDEQATGWRLEDECGRVVLHVCMRVRSATDSSLGCQGVPASMAAPDATKGDAGLIGSPAGGWQGSTVATAQGFQDRVRAGTCRPLDYDEFKAHAERMTQVPIKNTALSRLWALYQVIHGPGSEAFVLCCKVNADQTENNSVLDFHELEVKQPEFNTRIRDLVSESKIWHGLTGNRDLKKPTWVVYELLRQVGVRPTKHCRGPKEQDPDPKDFMYATRYVFCPDTLTRNRHRLQVDGIARGRNGRAADTKPSRTSAESSKPVAGAGATAAMVTGGILTAANVVGSPPPLPAPVATASTAAMAAAAAQDGTRAVLLKPPQVPNSTAAMPNGDGSAGLPPSAFHQPFINLYQPFIDLCYPPSTFHQPLSTTINLLSTFYQPVSTFYQPISTFYQPRSPSVNLYQPSTSLLSPYHPFINLHQPLSTFYQPLITPCARNPGPRRCEIQQRQRQVLQEQAQATHLFPTTNRVFSMFPTALRCRLQRRRLRPGLLDRLVLEAHLAGAHTRRTLRLDRCGCLGCKRRAGRCSRCSQPQLRGRMGWCRRTRPPTAHRL